GSHRPDRDRPPGRRGGSCEGRPKGAGLDWTSNPLFETAKGLGRAWAEANPQAGSRARALPALLFLTDPERTPEPWTAAARLPPGAGVVLRAFGRADALETGRRLAETARTRGLRLLVGADAALAEALGADGVHLPERSL